MLTSLSSNIHCQWLRLEFDLVQSYLEMRTLVLWKILIVVVNPTEGSGGMKQHLSVAAV